MIHAYCLARDNGADKESKLATITKNSYHEQMRDRSLIKNTSANILLIFQPATQGAPSVSGISAQDSLFL